MIRRVVLYLFQLMFATRSWAEVAWKFPFVVGVIFFMTLGQEMWLSGYDIVTGLRHALHDQVVAVPFVIGGILIVSKLSELQDQLERLAYTDLLTGIANRASFFKFTQEALDAGRAGTLLMVDADHFKKVNDAYGHATGDKCLIAMASFLNSRAPKGGIAARIGGEEFAVFLPEGFDAPHDFTDWTGPILYMPEGISTPRRINLSVGIVKAEPFQSLEDLTKLGDIALYAAKDAGRARAVHWSDIQHNHHHAKPELSAENDTPTRQRSSS